MSEKHRIRPAVLLVCAAVFLVSVLAVVLQVVAPPDAASPTPESTAQPPGAGRQADAGPSRLETGRSRFETRPSQFETRLERRANPAPLEPPGAPGPVDKDERLRWLGSLQDWGMKNPLVASSWAVENLSPEECWSFLGLTGGIAFQLGAKDMQQGLVLFQNLKKWDGQEVDARWTGSTIYSMLMAKFAAGAVASDPAKAIELAREFNSLYELAGHWAKLDVQQATQWARSLTDAVELDRVVEAITFALVNKNRDNGVMVDWVNTLVENPTAHDKAVTTMLEQLPRDALGPMLKALLMDAPPDAALALALIRGVGGGLGRGGNRYAEGPLRGELLQQIASGLGEGLLNNAEVQLALNKAYANSARTSKGVSPHY